MDRPADDAGSLEAQLRRERARARRARRWAALEAARTEHERERSRLLREKLERERRLRRDAARVSLARWVWRWLRARREHRAPGAAPADRPVEAPRAGALVVWLDARADETDMLLAALEADHPPEPPPDLLLLTDCADLARLGRAGLRVEYVPSRTHWRQTGAPGDWDAFVRDRITALCAGYGTDRVVRLPADGATTRPARLVAMLRGQAAPAS